MGKLKTINELSITTIMVPDTNKKQPCKHPTIPVKHIPKEELKQSAIEWIKEIRESFLQMDDESTVNIGGVWFTKSGLSGASAVLQNFFNISEEDLKESGKDGSKS